MVVWRWKKNTVFEKKKAEVVFSVLLPPHTADVLLYEGVSQRVHTMLYCVCFIKMSKRATRALLDHCCSTFRCHEDRVAWCGSLRLKRRLNELNIF